MERYTMFLDWENQYCQNDCSTQGKISIKLLMVFFADLEQQQQQKKNLKTCMDTQKTLKSQSNPEKEKQSWRN